MAAPKAPVIGGSKGTDVSLDEAVFAVELKPHLVHETVRAELNAARAGTRGSKSRGLVAGGRAKPWRQKGTGRARAGTTRAPHWTGGGVAFAPGMRSFAVKVNRKARRSALHRRLIVALDVPAFCHARWWTSTRSVVTSIARSCPTAFQLREIGPTSRR